METPIYDFVTAYRDSAALRLHMPGHKGAGTLGVEALDITEIGGADVLYHADGIIRRSEENAAGLFGTAKTVYSTEGSSLAIRAMLYLTLLYGKSLKNKCVPGGEGSGKGVNSRKARKPVIAAGRNAHKTFLTACALLDIEPVWLFPEKQGDLLSCEITAEELERFFTEIENGAPSEIAPGKMMPGKAEPDEERAEKPLAVYITSPDYLGHVADIRGLSEVCHRHGALLLVDNAHGAYLNFLPALAHPITLGADLCCDSAHKTLPVLTGGAYLHISKNAPKLFAEQAENGMSLFASTSPSYLILQSLDLANRYLADGYREKLRQFVGKTAELKEKLTAAGYVLVGDEPLKLTIDAKAYGFTGEELSDLLEKRNLICEFADHDYVVMMLTPESGEEALERIETTLRSIAAKPAIAERMPELAKPARAMSPREALFSVSRELDIRECEGKVLATATVSCPPAIPIVVCGEVIDEAAIRVMEYYGVKSCSVVEDGGDC